MTREEAIDTIKCNYPPSHYSMLCEALDMAMDALKNAEKYKWHNLRENPADLPTESGIYWVCVEGFDTEYALTFWNGYMWWGYSVIAWKEIEQFEVKE